MPRRKHGNVDPGGKWQVDNVNKRRDRRGISAPTSKANRASQDYHKAQNKARKAKAKNSSGGCAVTAMGVGGALLAGLAAWKGWRA